MGAHNRTLTTPELRRLLLDRAESGFEAQAVEGATLADLDPQRIERYLDRLMLQPADLGEGGWSATLHVWLLRLVRTPTCNRLWRAFCFLGATRSSLCAAPKLSACAMPVKAWQTSFCVRTLAALLVEQIRQAEAFVSANMRRGMRINGSACEELLSTRCLWCARPLSTPWPTAILRRAW